MLARSRLAPAAAVAAALATTAGCGGGGGQLAIGAPPRPQTTGTLVGPLCQYDRCTCAEAPGDIELPEGARKRFEIRLRSPQPLWLSMPGDTVLYKDAEKAEACFYVDLAPGQHPVTLRASAPEGVSAELVVRELGTKTGSFYETFTLSCGVPGVCSFDELAERKAALAAVPRGLHDPCGSTRIRGVSWDHGRAPDGVHPSELVVRATLDLYEFAPARPHGDPACGQGRGRLEAPAPAATPEAPAPAPPGG